MSAELLTLLSIDESDLVANRAGRMGDHQQALQRTKARRLTAAVYCLSGPVRVTQRTEDSANNSSVPHITL